MIRVLRSVVIVSVVTIAAVSLSSAFFSDTETSTNNTFQAGALDLKVGNTSYYNGVLQSPDSTSFSLRDLTVEKFFNFDDLKPGDTGEDTIALQVNTNDAWACYNLTLTQNDDNTCTTPEQVDDLTCTEPNEDKFDGDLAQQVNFVIWHDDGDNVLETGENIITQGPLSSLNPTLTGAIADSVTNLVGAPIGTPLTGNQTYYLGKAWCFGDLTLAPVAQNPDNDPTKDPGIKCNGSTVNNAAQTDVVMGDITFTATQFRNNPDFACKKLVETLTVNAADEQPVLSSALTSGRKYLIEVSGTANAGDTIDFDAKYSLTNRIPGDTWTDTVSGYESYGPTLLDLFMNTSAVAWGPYNPSHIYTTQTIGNGLPYSFVIYDIYYPNNTGSLTVKIYQLP